MKPDIRSRFTPDMLARLAGYYGVEPGELTSLDGFESFIYRFRRGQQGFILRIGHSSRRGETLVRGELDWLHQLKQGGAGVAEGVPAPDGSPLVTLTDGHGERFVAAVFREVSGVTPNDYGWSEALYASYGQAIGRMHRLSTQYRPADPLGRRPDWKDPAINDVAFNLAGIDPAALEKWEQLTRRCDALPAPPGAYGLIHFDAHGGNFLVDEDGALTFFDFDDCNVNWFAADIAILLFYKVMWEQDRAEATRDFLRPFLRGYRAEHRLDPAWLKTIPLFLTMREIDLYAVIHRDFDLDVEEDPWITGFMDGRREAIHAGRPFVDMDFTALKSWL